MRFGVLNIVNAVTLALLLLVWHFYELPVWYIVLAEVVYIAVLVWGCMTISSGFFMPVVCRAVTEDRVVALSFDDGPSPAYTPGILDTLKMYDVPAAFFCIGTHIRGNEHILQRIKDEGHIMGNHSYTHGFWFDMLGAGKMLADMRQMDEVTIKTTGLKPMLFRPPYGVMNPNLKRAIKKGGYTPVGWSIRSLDTKEKDKQKLLSRITGKMKPGDIILLHDTMQVTDAILPELIAQIRNKGFRIERLDKMLQINAYG